MSNTITKILAVVALLVAIGGYFYPHTIVSTPAQNRTDRTGGQFDTTNLSNLALSDGLVVGGLKSTTTPASMTLGAPDINNIALMSMNPTVGSVTITLPASTTLNTAGYLPNAGDTNRFFIHNATTTAATNITIAGGTGTLLQLASSTAAIPFKGTGTMDVYRKVNGDYVFVLESAQ